MLLPCTPCCKPPVPCGTELDPTPCPASVSVHACPTFWVEVAPKPYARKLTVSLDPNGATVNLLCGSVSVEDSNGVTLLPASPFTLLPKSITVPANEDKVQVVVAGFGVKPNPLGRCGPWDAGTPAPLLKVSCPSTPCGVAFEHDRLEVTVTADEVTAIYNGTGVNDFDPGCPPNGRIERFLDGLTDLDGVYELTLISDGNTRMWRYDFPAFGCYAAGENFIQVTATYNVGTGDCAINYELRFHHMEQREKHSGTPSAWAYACAGRGCPTATPCLWYGDVLDVASGSVSAREPHWGNANIPAASANIAPASVEMNKRSLCAGLSTPATLPRTSLTGNGEVTISLEFFS